MVRIDPCRYQVECKHCKMRIDLPRQSPLGRFPNLENLPKGEWPANFLCPVCERESSYFYKEILDVAQPLYPGQPPLGLLRTEYEHAQERSGERLVIYTPCTSGAPQAANTLNRRGSTSMRSAAPPVRAARSDRYASRNSPTSCSLLVIDSISTSALVNSHAFIG